MGCTFSFLSKFCRQLIQDRLKVVEDTVDDEVKEQHKVVNKIKALLNKKIHQSTGSAAGAESTPVVRAAVVDVDYSATTETTTDDTTTIPSDILRQAEITTASTTFSTTAITTESTTATQPPPVVDDESQPQPQPQQPTGFFQQLAAILSSFNPFGRK